MRANLDTYYISEGNKKYVLEAVASEQLLTYLQIYSAGPRPLQCGQKGTIMKNLKRIEGGRGVTVSAAGRKQHVEETQRRLNAEAGRPHGSLAEYASILGLDPKDPDVVRAYEFAEKYGLAM